jgi:hypothetical protein
MGESMVLSATKYTWFRLGSSITEPSGDLGASRHSSMILLRLRDALGDESGAKRAVIGTRRITIGNGIALCAHLLVFQAAPLLAQLGTGNGSVAVAVGGANRDVRDYDPFINVHSWGYSIGATYETASSTRSSVTVSASGAFFQGKKISPVPLNAAGAGSSLNRGVMPLLSTGWDPLQGNHGESELTLLTLNVDRRLYAATAEQGPYVGAGAGVSYLAGADQHTLRPVLEALGGFAVRVGAGRRVFVEAPISWMGVDVKHGSAKSPRWLVRPTIGASVSW